ncbi:MAG TPA: hypothetical protein VK524_13570 [Polyangiaceae bacterium]|nr:hypothetical protein [Polyangiaceae bacterium]
MLRSKSRGWAALLLAVVGAAAYGAELRAAPAAGKPATKKPSTSKASPGEAPRLSDEAELARVTSLYQAGKYAECAEALKELLPASAPAAATPAATRRPFSEPRVIERGRVYQAACWIGAGKPELADEPLRAAIRENPQMSPPDSLMFPTPVVERFIRVRETLLNEIRAAEEERVRKARAAAAQAERTARAEQERIRALEALAARETLLDTNSRWTALIPFGVGQFQNREPALGWVFLTTEIAFLGAALTSTAVTSHLNLEASRAGNLESPEEVDARLNDWHNLLVFSSYGFLAAATAGIVQAQLAFVPEFRSVRRRELPPHLRTLPRASLRLRPQVWSSAKGAQFGLSGAF